MNHIKHALGGGDPAVIITSATVTKTQYVNEAGRLLVAARRWKFLERPPTTVNYTISTNYVSLPTDFSQLIEVQPKTGTIGNVHMVTFATIAEYRRINGTSIGDTYAAIVHPTQANVSSAPATPRLELWPTPTANVTDALTLWYRAGWVALSSGTDVPNIPTWAESLLVLLCRAVAQGYEKEDLGTVDDRVAKVLAGPMFAMVKEQDEMVQTEYGTLGPGLAADVSYGYGEFGMPPGWTVSDPA